MYAIAIGENIADRITTTSKVYVHVSCEFSFFFLEQYVVCNIYFLLCVFEYLVINREYVFHAEGLYFAKALQML